MTRDRYRRFIDPKALAKARVVANKTQPDGDPKPNKGTVKINPSTGRVIDPKPSSVQTTPRR